MTRHKKNKKAKQKRGRRPKRNTPALGARVTKQQIILWSMRTWERGVDVTRVFTKKNGACLPSAARASQAGRTTSGHCKSQNSKLLFLSNLFGKKGEIKHCAQRASQWLRAFPSSFRGMIRQEACPGRNGPSKSNNSIIINTHSINKSGPTQHANTWLP